MLLTPKRSKRLPNVTIRLIWAPISNRVLGLCVSKTRCRAVVWEVRIDFMCFLLQGGHPVETTWAWTNCETKKDKRSFPNTQGHRRLCFVLLFPHCNRRVPSPTNKQHLWPAWQTWLKIGLFMLLLSDSSSQPTLSRAAKHSSSRTPVVASYTEPCSQHEYNHW